MPQKSSVVGSDDQIIAPRVDVERGDPASPRLDDFNELLLLEIVASDGALGGDEEKGSRRVELDGLRDAWEAAERYLCEMFR